MMAYWLRSSILLCVGAVYGRGSFGLFVGRSCGSASRGLALPDPGMTESDVLCVMIFKQEDRKQV